MSDTIDIKTAVERQLMSLPGVSGIGIGRNSPEKINVYLKTECPSCRNKIPDEIGGVQTQVIVTGNISALNSFQSTKALGQQQQTRYRPAPGGVSIAHKDVTAGSGVTCYDNNTNEKLILSNNHVLANEHSIQRPGAVIGDAILQPGKYDGGLISQDTIATLAKISSLDMSNENEYDCAVARPINQDDLSTEILDIGRVTDMSTPTIGNAILKSGRTTGLTESKIIDTSATIKVNYSRLGDITFRNQVIAVPAFAKGGDSGSLVVRKEDNVAVGLLFAGSDNISIINPIIPVAQAMNINFGGDTVPPLAATNTDSSDSSPWGTVAVLGLSAFALMKLRRKK